MVKWLLSGTSVAYLYQINYPLGKGRCKLPHLLEGKAIHVKYDYSTGNLCLRLQHGDFKEQHTAFVYFIQRDFVMLPFLCTHTTMILLIPLHMLLWLLVSETCPAGGHRILVGRQRGRNRSTLNQILQIYVSLTHLSYSFVFLKLSAIYKVLKMFAMGICKNNCSEMMH